VATDLLRSRLRRRFRNASDCFLDSVVCTCVVYKMVRQTASAPADIVVKPLGLSGEVILRQATVKSRIFIKFCISPSLLFRWRQDNWTRAGTTIGCPRKPFKMSFDNGALMLVRIPMAPMTIVGLLGPSKYWFRLFSI